MKPRRTTSRRKVAPKVRITNREAIDLLNSLGCDKGRPDARLDELRRLHAQGAEFINVDVERLCEQIQRGRELNRTVVALFPKQFHRDIWKIVDKASVRPLNDGDGLFSIEFHPPSSKTKRKSKRVARPLRLTIGMIPRTSWGQSGYRKFNRSSWNDIRDAALRRCQNRCAICRSTDRLACHEEWEFDDAEHVQRLVAFVVLCNLCHHVNHAGRAEMLADEGRLNFEDVIAHFRKVIRSRARARAAVEMSSTATAYPASNSRPARGDVPPPTSMTRPGGGHTSLMSDSDRRGSGWVQLTSASFFPT
jgi:hypothetical protein